MVNGRGDALLDAELRETRSIVDLYMKDWAQQHPEVLSGAASLDAYSSPGKRVRSVLLLWVVAAVGGRYQEALPLALIYELGHTASLVQDDIMDGAMTRRGRPSVQAQYGPHAAIIVSDMLLFSMFHLLGELAPLLTTSQVGDILVTIARAGTATCQGQMLDVQRKADCSVQEYLETLRLKTGAMLRGAAEAATLFAGATELRKTMAEFGESLGVAFQIRDDYFNLFGSEEQTGKPQGLDLVTGSNVLIALAREREPSGMPADMALPARDLLDAYLDRAADRLGPLPASDAKSRLLRLLEALRLTHLAEVG